MKTAFSRQRRLLLKSLSGLPMAHGVSLLSGANRAHAQSSACDTGRSLVCIFLAGGADSFNLFVPGGQAYSDYRAVRNDLAVDESALIDVNDATQGSFGFNRAVSAMADLYQQERLCVIANTGTLIRPTTRSDYLATASLPQALFAHNTQQKLWQTGAGIVSGSDAFGWGGAIGDHAANCNGAINIAPAFSIAGSSDWLASANSRYITLNAAVPVERMFGYDNISDWIPRDRLNRIGGTLDRLIAAGEQSGDSALMREVSGSIGRATDATEALHSALLDNPLDDMEYDRRNKLARQLHLVARLIASRERLGMQQQVFFALMGGWDTHSDQNVRLPVLLQELNEAVGSFQATLDARSLASSVTSFTASDFGRTLTSNGNGTDHGWGGHNFVFGGAVNGGQVVGAMPNYASRDNPDDAGDEDGSFAGRIIPQISVNQYGATLARWMGVSETALANALPDLQNFTRTDLGFMQL